VHKPKSARNSTGFSSRGKRESENMLTAGLSGRNKFSISDAGRRRFVCDKGQLQIADETVANLGSLFIEGEAL